MIASLEVEPIPTAFAQSVAATLEEFIDDQHQRLAPVGDQLTPLLDAARSAVAGGKRLRPAFVYWGWRAAGGGTDRPGTIITAASAIELVHASALVHDDVMDDSATRRGEPAAHRQFARQHEQATGPAAARRFGSAAAILLGDLLLAWADELLSRSRLKKKAIARGRVYFDLLRTEVAAGQFLDVLAQTRGSSSAADALRVVRYKSAKYTVERPLQFGAALAKADPRLLSALSSYGIPLGEAFQLRDDILGVFGEATVTGKPSSDDIREGKRTLLVARAQARSSPQQRAVLERHFADPEVDADGVAAVQAVIRDTGALDAVETVIAELGAAARSTLERAPIEDPEARAALHVLTDRLTDRAL